MQNHLARNGSGLAKPAAPLQIVPDAQHAGSTQALVSARRAANVVVNGQKVYLTLRSAG